MFSGILTHYHDPVIDVPNINEIYINFFILLWQKKVVTLGQTVDSTK